MKGKVLIAALADPVLTEGLTALGYEVLQAEKISREEAIDLIGDCTGLVTSNRLKVDKALLDAAAQLKWIGRLGSGMEIIDVAAAESRGILLFSSPEGNANAVAEHVLGMLISLQKKIAKSFAEIRNGQWLRNANRGEEIAGKTVAIIGYGHTGKAFAKKLLGFEARVLAYDVLKKEAGYPHVQMCRSIEEVFSADILSFHVPLTAGTEHYFNRQFLAEMKQPFILLNTSRGEIVETGALLAGLESGKIKGACLDVWPEEPLVPMSAPLRAELDAFLSYEQVIMTPHIAGYSLEALNKMSSIILEKIRQIPAL